MNCSRPCSQADIDQRHSQWIMSMEEMSNGSDIRGIEIAGTIRMLTRFFDLAVRQSTAYSELSGPRLGILLRLMVEDAGINPTHLSHMQNVKKNTISALISGLEEQGLVERSVDPVDKRGYIIRITPSGRELVKSTAPGRFEFMNHAVASLTSEEKDHLLVLLNKLHVSLAHQIHIPNEDNL